jgi:hypothetical protein
MTSSPFSARVRAPDSQSSNDYPESYLGPAAGLVGILLAGSLLGQRQRAAVIDPGHRIIPLDLQP